MHLHVFQLAFKISHFKNTYFIKLHVFNNEGSKYSAM